MLCLQILASDVIKFMTGVSQSSGIPPMGGGGGSPSMQSHNIDLSCILLVLGLEK